MNKSKNSVLNWRSRPLVRTEQIFGVLAGASITILAGIILFNSTLNPSPTDSHGFPFSFSDVLLWGVLALPTILIYKAVGLTWILEPQGHVILKICVVALVNSFFGFLIGTAIGWLLNKKQNAQNEVRL